MSETPRLDRDLGGRGDGRGRYFTREQLEALAREAQHDPHAAIDLAMICAYPGWDRLVRSSTFSISPVVEKQESPPALRLGNE